jgi:hypothetical protein
MTNHSFNAITYQNKLMSAGLTDQASRVHAEEIQNILNSEIATRHDITLLRQEIVNTEHKMVIKLGSLVIGCTFIISLMIGILSFLMK